MNELVSVIMPSYNTAAYIGDAIKSVLEQTYQYWELIIVDDCSTDDTDKVVHPYLVDTRLKYFKNKKNSGAAITRNRALREAKGEWIAFLDSDDLWKPEKLEKQIRFMHENGYKLSYTEYEKINENGKAINIIVSGPKIIDKNKIYNYDYIGQLTMMYNAKHFGLIQIDDIKKNNDYAIILQLYKRSGTKAYILKENLASYRIRKNSISHDKMSRKLRSHFDLYHICDKKNFIVALWFTCKNIWFGLWKKIYYERDMLS